MPSLCNLTMRTISTLTVFLLLVASVFSASAFAQGSKRKSLYDPIEEQDKDRPGKRAEWMMRGREAPKGQSAAALRLRAHQQKMAMRAAREAAAKRAGNSAPATPATAGWVALGPAPLVSDQDFYGLVSGRSTAIAIDQSDATGNTVYAAAASGGVWKSTNAANANPATVTWTPLTDQQASLTNGAVSVKADGSVVLVGTGEPDNAIDSYYGVGILRSTDKGATWTLIPSSDSGAHPFAGLGFSKFAWDSATGSTNTVVAAAADSFKGDQEALLNLNTSNWGLYLSTDMGATWTYQTPTDNSLPSPVTDVTYNLKAGKFFAAIQYHGLYSSTDGTHWTRLTNQPDPTNLSLGNCPTIVQFINNASTCPMFRGQLTTVPGRNEMYFWYVDGSDNDFGIWQSTNGGAAWTQIDETGITVCGDVDNQGNPAGCGTEQAFYNLEISAIGDPDGTSTDIYAGAVNLFRCKLANKATTCSTVDANLPKSWLNLTHVYGCSSIANVHPDEHGLDFMVVGGKDIMYFGNDGGVSRALDGFTGLDFGSCNSGTNQFDNLNTNIGSMTQFVSFSLHPTDQNTLLGGTQDNGSPATSTATSSSQFATVLGGDGGYNAINPNKTEEWFASTPVSEIVICELGINCENNFFYVASPDVLGNIDTGAFYTPFILDPQNTSEMLIGTCRVLRGAATINSVFNELSVNFDTLDISPCSGFETNQVHGLAAGGPKDSNGFSNVIYAVTFGLGPVFGPSFGPAGEVWATTNAATTALSNVTGTINPSNYAISSVAMDNTDTTGQTAYVGIMGFNTSHVFKTTDAGGTGLASDWTDWSGTGLPDSPVNDLFVDSSVNPAQLYAATDVGIFVSSTSSPSWTEVGPSPSSGQAGYLPNVPVSAIRLFNSAGLKKLRVSTYGRGIWEYTLAVPATTTTTLTSSQNPANQGTAVTFTATVTTTGANPPTGSVTFKDGTTTLGTGTLSTVAGSQVATFMTSTLTVGAHSITAVYGGDANNPSSTSSVLTQTINAATTTTTTVTSSLNPASQGAAVTFTATVATSGTHPPTGTVTFNDGGTAIGSGSLSTVAGSQVATFTTSALTVGMHSITAVYGGDANNPSSTSSVLAQTITATTTTTLTSSLNPANQGMAVTFTATVATTGSHPATGTVTFNDGAASLGTGTLNTVAGSQVATFTTSTLAVGAHPITAVYGGDGNNSGSTSSVLTQTINTATTTTTLTSSQNPAVQGTAVTFTATVATAGTHPPTGTVTFNDGAASLGTGTLNTMAGAQVATLTTSSLTAGTHSITAVYAGDTNNAGSTSLVLTQTITAVTTTTLIPSANPANQGAPVTFTATVATAGTHPPTGTVTFKDGSTALGMGTLNGSLMATLTTSALAGGSHSITAVYGGDANNAGSTSSALPEAIVATTTTALTASANSIPSGASVTFTATVTAVNSTGPAPTGTVTFKNGTSTLGTGTLASGVATLTTTTLVTIGTDSITAVYGGDTNNQGSTSSPLTEPVTAATFTISASPATQTISSGGTATITVTVTPQGVYTSPISFAATLTPTSTATIKFNPAMVTPNGSTATTMLTIQGATSGTRRAANRATKSSVLNASLLWTPLGLAGLFLVGRRRKDYRKVVRNLLLAAGLLLIALTMFGCGGGGSSPPPTQTYTVQITATAAASGNSGAVTTSTTVSFTAQ